jgi:hypothetical protein
MKLSALQAGSSVILRKSFWYSFLLDFISGTQVPNANTAKYLGMNLDAKLRWKKHIKKQRDELNIKFRKIYWLLGRKSDLSIHNSIILYKLPSSGILRRVALVTSQKTKFFIFTAVKPQILCEECRLLRYKIPFRTSQETHYISATEASRLMLRKILSFHSSYYEEYSLLAHVRNDILEERRFLQEPHGVRSQKAAFFISHPLSTCLPYVMPSDVRCTCGFTDCPVLFLLHTQPT